MFIECSLCFMLYFGYSRIMQNKKDKFSAFKTIAIRLT